MYPLNSCAGIAMCKINRTFTYRGTTVLTLSICYPKVSLQNNQCAQNSINSEIQNQVCGFARYASCDLYREAVDGCNDAQANGYPFRPYDAVMVYEITYNDNCHLSLYRDQYTYTGGAHGSTIRSSNTWNLTGGRSVSLSELFPAGQDYRAQLIAEMIRQAGENPDIYFDDYPDLIAKYFDEDSYYLIPSGFAVYYQQYQIAPYSTGIVVFPIEHGAPSC